MDKVYQGITPKLGDWIAQQHMFFVATAPLSADGFVNCSPKGLDTFRVLGSREIAYLDLTGSGVETIAHLRENRRIVFMFCAFDGPPKIVRLHGEGEVVTPQHSDYPLLLEHFQDYPGARAIIRARITRISDSCGFSVPLYDYVGQRDTLVRFAEKKGEAGLAEYRRANNAASLDGLAGLDVPEK